MPAPAGLPAAESKTTACIVEGRPTSVDIVSLSSTITNAA
jgi:hypothetical protein